MGCLYVLAEQKEEVRLLALDPATGDLWWSQQLSAVEQSLVQDPLRRHMGVSPSYADGILVCPTSTGALVGVDLANRSLLWAHCYVAGNNRGMRPPWVFMRANDEGGDGTAGWADSGVCIAGDRVLATPRDSDALLCLKSSRRPPPLEVPAARRPLSGLRRRRGGRAGGADGGPRVRLAHGPAGFAPQRGLPRRQHAQRPRLPERKPLLRSPRFRGSGGRRSGHGPNRGRGQIAAAARAGQPGG